MASLKEIVTALQQELQTAFSDPQESAVRLHPERLTLSLELLAIENPNSNPPVQLSFKVARCGPATSEPAVQAAPAGRHLLTLEIRPEFLKPPSASVPHPPAPSDSSVRSVASVPLDGSEAQQTVQALGQVFGVPGFDSSARATVFREALDGLSPEQARAAVDSLGDETAVPADGAAKRARHLIRNVIRSGPLRSFEQGAAILAKLFRQYSVESIVRLVHAKWKTQEEWIDKPIPRSPSSNGEPPSPAGS